MADHRPPLSDTQAKVMAYLVKFLELNDQLPTNAKIAEAFGWASPNSADTHLKAMEKKGYLARNELHHLMLADRPTDRAPASTTSHMRGQILVMSKLLVEALNIVSNVEAADSIESELLQDITDRAEAAVDQATREHGMVWMGIDKGAKGGDITAFWPPRSMEVATGRQLDGVEWNGRPE